MSNNKAKRPVIGITCQRYKGEPEQVVHGGYIQSVEEAGGIPLVIPMTPFVEELANLCHGFLLIGSVADVNPQLYGKEPPLDNYSDHDRDRVDYAILQHAEKHHKPVFGICRGCQIMNVFRGGTLALHFTHLIETETEHSSLDYSGPIIHEVDFLSDSHLGTIVHQSLGKSEALPVNSIHRQVVDQLGTQLRIAAKSHDGLIEAIEDQQAPHRYFAVQWHPERAPEMKRDDLSKLLFERLIQTAQEQISG